MRTHEAVVVKLARHSHDVVTVYFTLVGGALLDYESGQYVSVYAPNGSVPEGKAYSLSSAPHEPLMSITVKDIGEYSHYICGLQVGDRFMISPAYGHFNPKCDKPLVCIGAGVGISPIWSVLKDELVRDAERVAHFFYSNKHVDDIPHRDEVDEITNNTNLSVHHHITKQLDVPELMHKGRIELDNVVSAIEDEAMYLVCGSSEFVRHMYAGLTERGVLPGQISTETFFEQ